MLVAVVQTNLGSFFEDVVDSCVAEDSIPPAFETAAHRLVTMKGPMGACTMGVFDV